MVYKRQSRRQDTREKSLSEKEKALHRASLIFEQKVIPHFNNLGEILDIGTGSGYTAFTLAKHFKKVVSIDSDPECLKTAESKVAEQNIENIHFLQMDAHNLKFLDESFDAVTCRAAIHHFDDAAKVLAEVYRVLKKEGFFVLMDFCFSEMTKKLLAPLSWIREDDFRRYYTFHEYCNLLENNGFVIDTMYTYTLPRVIQEWVAVAPPGIQERLISAFLHLADPVHAELRLHQQQGQYIMTYRILEVISQKS